MHFSTFGHVLNFINSAIPIRQFLPLRECREFTYQADRVRNWIRERVIERMTAMKNANGHNQTSDALQYMLEYTDSDWGVDQIVEYVSALLLIVF